MSKTARARSIALNVHGQALRSKWIGIAPAPSCALWICWQKPNESDGEFEARAEKMRERFAALHPKAVNR